MTFYPTRHLLAFICSYSRLPPATPKMWEKKELETVFQLFWNNINQLMMDHRKSYEHENEIRALTSIYYTDNAQLYKKEVVNNGVYIPASLDTLIEKIYASPTAPVWFEELVKSIVNKYNLRKEVMTSTLSKRPLY